MIPSTAPTIVSGVDVKSPSKIAPQMPPIRLQRTIATVCIMVH